MYFSAFPKIYYDAKGDDNPKVVTNLLRRVAIRTKVKNNVMLYDTYDVKNGETPEIIADKFYGNPERHWIVLGFNQIVDPQWDWPLQYPTFIKYVDNKYRANADTANGQTGLAFAQSEISVPLSVK